MKIFTQNKITMSIKKDVEDIFRKNTGYAEPEHAINQAESLKSLSADLYTDSKRFIYELLQNADDSVISNAPVRVAIKIFDDFLVVAHNGKPFDSRDLRGICGVSDGTKKKSVEKTGYKGIGFKAVFGQSSRVLIYSDKEFFEFNSNYPFNWNLKWGTSQTSWEKKNDRLFSYPWQIIPIYIDYEKVDERIINFIENGEFTVATVISLSKGKSNIKKALQELSSNINMYLFLKNVQEIDFNLGTTNIITLHRQKTEGTIEIKQNNITRFLWILKTIKLKVPSIVQSELREEKNIPDKLLYSTETELTFAAKIYQDSIQKLENNERLLYSYLPTEETKYSFPVLVNSSFVMGANREKLHEDSKWNQWLFKAIPSELFIWISELIIGRYGQSSYELLPTNCTTNNILSQKYNQGLSMALQSIPFILSNHHQLLKIKETIIDFTSITKNSFFTEDVTREFIIDKNKNQSISLKPFAPHTIYSNCFRNIGANIFDWVDIPKILASDIFLKRHSSLDNIQLIQFLKKECENDKQKSITEDIIKNWPFILDHKGYLQYPNNIYFPAADENNWNDPNSEISFLHGDTQTFLLQNSEIRIWLESLGIIEKTNLSYLRKTIIANASTFGTKENTLQTISTIYNLYSKSEIGKKELSALSELEILTQQDTLLAARYCYFSDLFEPRLKLENEIIEDVFVNQMYLPKDGDKSEWKRFFKMMGVSEGISNTIYDDEHRKNLVNKHNFKNDYFVLEDKYFKPYWTKFHADIFSNLTTLTFLSKTIDFEFAIKFWEDVIQNIVLENFNTPAVAYWGENGKNGRILGNEVANYINWYIKDIECLPTVMKSVKKAEDIFLNSESIIELTGNYLPVFFTDKISQDWKSFFNFKTQLQLEDYLEVLRIISTDLNKDKKVKKDNVKRIQLIYKALLDQCANWSQIEIKKVEEWAIEGQLLTSKNIFHKCTNIKFYTDGNESIFQDQFPFLAINAENKSHLNLEFFLGCFNIKILRQNDFQLRYSQKEICAELINKLILVIPYFKKWIESELVDYLTQDSLENLELRIKQLNIYQTSELKINYEEINFVKNVNVHFSKPNLYLTKPWNSNNVLLKLSEILSKYLFLLGHEKKLDFLLRSTKLEIVNYFLQENISVTKDIFEDFLTEQKSDDTELTKYESLTDTSILSADFFHLSKPDYDSLNYAKNIISRAVLNVLKYLKTLPEYDCSNYYVIAESVIAGIKKNGNDITVVARPSEKDYILLYYSSEFDVLEYVDAELWYENDKNFPQQLTLGQLLKKTGINKIPIKNIDITSYDLNTFLTTPKNEELEFNPIPYAPQKIAQIISSFANTNGGSLSFGIKEIKIGHNEVVGLSNDFQIDEITKRAILTLNPIPIVEHYWVKIEDKPVYMIKTEKSQTPILFENKKYIRKENKSYVEGEGEEKQSKIILNVPTISRTIAIIIAIENYFPKSQIKPVKYANNDANKFKDMLINKLDVKESEILMFVNENALQNSINYDLKLLFNSLKEDDRLIFYYVGHGFHNGITNYLSTYDTNGNTILTTSVPLNNILIDPLRKSDCKNALIFIDACATIIADENERSHLSNINEEELLILSEEFPNYSIFLSCQVGQSSYSSDQLKNGIWTHHLLDAICGNVPEVMYSNKYITDMLLRDYLSSAVADYTMKEQKKEQNPKAIIDSSYANIIREIKH